MRTLAHFVLSLPIAACYCPPPGALLPPPAVPSSGFSSSNFAIPSSAFTSFPWHNKTSFAIKASIGNSTVFNYASTAEGYEFAQPLYETKARIASVTKLFTVLAVLKSDDKISWDDSITKFVPELKQEFYGDVTIGALAGHTSGLGRFGYVGDLAMIPGFIPAQFGIPPVNNTLPGCDPFPGGRVCSPEEVIDMFNHPAYRPYSPNSGPLYSNIAFNLLGMALEAVHSKPYEQIIDELIFSPLGMTHTSFETPKDDGTAILPNDPSSGWFVADFANFNPGGGAWSTSDDLLIFLQALQSHDLLSAPETRKWLQPRSLVPSLQQLVGAPWEILRPTDLNVSFSRPIDVYTKAGGVTGYAAYAIVIPEYDIAIAFNAAGRESNAAVMDILPVVIEPLVAYADAQARAQATPKYAGKFVASDSNSTNSITLVVDDGPGIAITSFTMNGVPVLVSLAALQGVRPENFSARLYPTDPDSLGTAEESWRILLDQKERDNGFAEVRCASWNWADPYRYVREPLDTVVFEFDPSGDAISVELLGWRAKLTKQS